MCGSSHSHPRAVQVLVWWLNSRAITVHTGPVSSRLNPEILGSGHVPEGLGYAQMVLVVP